jgi:HEAT repeat protein
MAGRSKRGQDVSKLLAALEKEKGKRLALRRFRLVKALGAAEDPRAVGSLSRLLRTDRSAEVRAAAVVALGRIGDPSASPAVKGALGDPENRWWAIRGLGLLRDRSSVQWFIGYLSSSYPLTREFVADALGDIGDRAAVPTLIDALEDPKASVRQAAAVALAKIGDPQALEPVRRAHRSARCLSRRAMGKALARLEGDRELNSKWPKERIVIEQKVATPFLVAAILEKAAGLRGAKERRRVEAQYLARNFSSNFFSDPSDPEPREFLEQAIGEFPDDPILRLLYAPMLAEIRPDDVAAEAAKAAELGPDDPVVLVRAGHLLLTNGDRDAARSCASRATQLMSPDSVFMSNLDNLNGLLAAFAGEDDLAEEKLRSAVEREPDFEPFIRNLAVFLAERGRLREGAEVLDEALKHVEKKDEIERMRNRMAAEAEAGA